MRKSLLILILLVCATMIGCASATPVKPEPLTADKHSELQCLLTGTWEHLSSGGTQLMKSARNAYILKEDGTGYVRANSGSQAMGVNERLVDFEWKLDGRNLHLVHDDGDESVFRVDTWSTANMNWFFYNASADYEVVRLTEEGVPDC